MMRRTRGNDDGVSNCLLCRISDVRFSLAQFDTGEYDSLGLR